MIPEAVIRDWSNPSPSFDSPASEAIPATPGPSSPPKRHTGESGDDEDDALAAWKILIEQTAEYFAVPDLPTPAEIEHRREAIKAGWSEKTRLDRQVIKPQAWAVPAVQKP